MSEKSAKTIQNLIDTQKALRGLLELQQNANTYLFERIEKLENKLLLIENEKKVLNTFSKLLPTSMTDNANANRD
tara:strand:+ start:3094 stop:3318 length:225 start_codon:yes stop_codon:yes gene_type:complete